MIVIQNCNGESGIGRFIDKEKIKKRKSKNDIC